MTTPYGFHCLYCDTPLPEKQRDCVNVYCDIDCSSFACRNAHGGNKRGFQYDTIAKVLRTVSEIGPATANEIANETQKRFKILGSISARRIRGIFLHCNPECYESYHNTTTQAIGSKISSGAQPLYYEVVSGNCIKDWVKDKYLNRQF
jgi:hypothetical protein